MNKKTTGILAGTAGAALLIGGGTFALWSDGATTAAGTLTTGNLDVASCSSPVTWTDTSAGRSDVNHAINLATWKGVPGDTITGEFCFQGALEGDNLVATLASATDLPSGAWLTSSVRYSHLTGSGWSAPSATAPTFSSIDNPQKGALPTLPAAVGTDNIKVVVTLTINNGTTVNAADDAPKLTGTDLQNVAVTLTQTRTAGAGGGF